ncbi:DUF308 domain-containing protein [Myxococcota bacterium]|nr:DUF308 domain-containing protein [Myxococcota bacterium]
MIQTWSQDNRSGTPIGPEVVKRSNARPPMQELLNPGLEPPAEPQERLAMPETPIPTLSPEAIAEHSKGLTTLGIVFVILGVLAVAVPNVATFAIETLVGVLIFLAGCAHLVHAFRPTRWQGFVMDILVGALFVLGGGLLLLYPLEGELTLTLILALTFVAEGIFKLIASARIRGHGGSGWMII